MQPPPPSHTRVLTLIRACPTAEWATELLDKMGPRFAGPIAIIRNWTYCLFYVMAEL